MWRCPMFSTTGRGCERGPRRHRPSLMENLDFRRYLSNKHECVRETRGPLRTVGGSLSRTQCEHRFARVIVARFTPRSVTLSGYPAEWWTVTQGAPPARRPWALESNAFGVF